MRTSLYKLTKYPQIKMGVLLFLLALSTNFAQAQGTDPGFNAAPGSLVDVTSNSGSNSGSNCLNNTNINNGNFKGVQGSYQAPGPAPSGNFTARRSVNLSILWQRPQPHLWDRGQIKATIKGRCRHPTINSRLSPTIRLEHRPPILIQTCNMGKRPTIRTISTPIHRRAHWPSLTAISPHP